MEKDDYIFETLQRPFVADLPFPKTRLFLKSKIWWLAEGYCQLFLWTSLLVFSACFWAILFDKIDEFQMLIASIAGSNIVELMQQIQGMMTGDAAAKTWLAIGALLIEGIHYHCAQTARRNALRATIALRKLKKADRKKAKAKKTKKI